MVHTRSMRKRAHDELNRGLENSVFTYREHQRTVRQRQRSRSPSPTPSASFSQASNHSHQSRASERMQGARRFIKRYKPHDVAHRHRIEDEQDKDVQVTSYTRRS